MKKLALVLCAVVAGTASLIVGCGGVSTDSEKTALCNDGRNSYEEDCANICVGRGGVAKYYKDCSGSSIGLGSR